MTGHEFHARGRKIHNACEIYDSTYSPCRIYKVAAAVNNLIYCNCIKVITQQHDSIPNKMSILLTYIAMRYNRNVAQSAL